MVCITCGDAPSILGRTVKGRSTAGYDYRAKNEYGGPYERGDIIYNGSRPYGVPKSDAQRLATHTAVFGEGALPPRGTGMNGEFPWGTLVVGGILGLVFGYFIFASSGRQIGYEAGRRTARKIRG